MLRNCIYLNALASGPCIAKMPVWHLSKHYLAGAHGCSHGGTQPVVPKPIHPVLSASTCLGIDTVTFQ